MLVTKESAGLCESLGVISKVDRGGAGSSSLSTYQGDTLVGVSIRVYSRVHCTQSVGGGIPWAGVPDGIKRQRRKLVEHSIHLSLYTTCGCDQ